MPSILELLGYKVFFWSNENLEPIHVHVCKGVQSENATKIWLLRDGGCVVAHNRSEIPERDLRKIMAMVSSLSDTICQRWKEYFRVDEIKYFA